MARNPHFAVDDLSEEARRIARDGLERNYREQAIIAKIERVTEEKIATSSFNRYAAWYRGEMRRRALVLERTEVAVETAVKMGAQMTEGVRAELLQTFYELSQEGELKKTSPFLLVKLALNYAEAERKDKELALKEQQLELDRRKLEQLIGRQERMKKAAEGVKEIMEGAAGDLTPEKLAKLKEFYGVAVQ